MQLKPPLKEWLRPVYRRSFAASGHRPETHAAVRIRRSRSQSLGRLIDLIEALRNALPAPRHSRADGWYIVRHDDLPAVVAALGSDADQLEGRELPGRPSVQVKPPLKEWERPVNRRGFARLGHTPATHVAVRVRPGPNWWSLDDKLRDALTAPLVAHGMKWSIVLRSDLDRIVDALGDDVDRLDARELPSPQGPAGPSNA